MNKTNYIDNCYHANFTLYYGVETPNSYDKYNLSL